MKKVLLSTTLMVLVPVLSQLVGSTTYAANDLTRENREALVHTTHHSLTIELNDKTVVCSRADYAEPMLKVLIPGLSDITLLNHQNFRAGAPCVTSGDTCRPSSIRTDRTSAMPADILQGRPGTEQVDVTVTLVREEMINHTEKTCDVVMREKVETLIRGKKFDHERRASLGSRVYADCLR